MTELLSEISAWMTIALMLGILVMASRLVGYFEHFPAWRHAWIAFAIGLMGMAESRVLVLLLAYDIDSPVLRFIRRAVTPLQMTIGLLSGLYLLHRILQRVLTLHHLIHLPHPAGFLLDAQSVVQAWDAGAEALFGWTSAEAIGQTLMDLVTPERIRTMHLPITERYLRAGTSGGLSQRFTISACTRDRPEEFSVEIILTAEIDASGQPSFKGIARRLSAW